MQRWLEVTLVIGSLVAVAGCASKGSDGEFIQHDPNVTNSGKSDGGLDSDSFKPDPLAPVIEVLDPLPAKDPNADTLVTSSDVVMRCRVTKSKERRARDVDQSSVAMQALWADKTGTEHSVSATVSSISETEFEGRMSLAMVPNGAVRFKCSARDLFQSGTPLLGWLNVDTFLDLGPDIKIVDPKEGKIYALKQVLVVSFRADPAPVSDLDKEADVTDLVLTIANRQFDLTETAGDPGLYTATIDFNDRTFFDMPPSTAQIVVSARSSRTPEPGRRSEVVNILLDSTGPDLKIAAPTALTIVRGEVTLSLSISDPSGVDLGSVAGTINTDLFVFDRWTVQGNSYSQRFDTRTFGDALTQLTINVKASDSVGNQSTDSVVVRLDNVPPILSLDPPMLREYKVVNDQTICTAPYDPVGTAAASDGDYSQASTIFRVMVWDETQGSPGAPARYVANVNDKSMVVFAQVPGIPLLVDTDGDGACDEINKNSLDPDNFAEQIPMSPISPGGTLYYPPVGPDNPALRGCAAGTDGATHGADPVCVLSPDVYRIPPARTEGGPFPGIYGFGPNQANECAGTSWELGRFTRFKGWACIAARVEDTIGNVGISPPIRVCYGQPGSDECNMPMPSCTDGCSLPPDMHNFSEAQFMQRAR